MKELISMKFRKGLSDIFKGDIKKTPAIEFITVELELGMVFPDKTEDIDKETLRVANEIVKIFHSTIVIFNRKGEFLGAINPALDKDSLALLLNNKELMSRNLLKLFQISFDKKDSSYCLRPQNNSKYSIRDLYNDFYTIFNASKFLEEHYGNCGLDILVNTYNTFMIGNKPAIRHNDKLVSYAYLVEDRLKYEKGWEDYAKKIFPMTIKECYEQVMNNSHSSNNANQKWLQAVEKLLGYS